MYAYGLLRIVVMQYCKKEKLCRYLNIQGLKSTVKNGRPEIFYDRVQPMRAKLWRLTLECIRTVLAVYIFVYWELGVSYRRYGRVEF